MKVKPPETGSVRLEELNYGDPFMHFNSTYIKSHVDVSRLAANKISANPNVRLTVVTSLETGTVTTLPSNHFVIPLEGEFVISNMGRSEWTGSQPTSTPGGS